MAYVYQGHIEKIPILQEILADAKIDSSQVAYIGDEFHRYRDHAPGGPGHRHGQRPRGSEAGGSSHYPSPRRRRGRTQVVELLLKAQGKWQEILEHYEVG